MATNPIQSALLVMGALGGLAGVPAAQITSREPHAYMKTIGFTDREIAELDQGKVVARVLPGEDDNEASVMGVVHCKGREDAFVEQYRKIETFRKGGRVLQIGRLSNPPRIEDLKDLTFEAKELEDLRRCKVGDCEFKIGPRGLQVARQVDWTAPDAVGAHVVSRFPPPSVPV